MAKRKINKKKVQKLLVLIILAIIIIVGAIVVIDNLNKEPQVKESVKVIDSIKDYKLHENETEYYKQLFNLLKEELTKEEINEEEYAKIVAQLFLTDFFTLDNKLNKNDIGGTQYVYKDFQTDFEKLARESVYHEIENNIYGDRKQSLPIVTSVDIVGITQQSYDYLNKKDNEAFYVDLNIKYEKDLGYQENVSLIIIHSNDKLEIAEMSE
jgi:hypothetical protein